MIKYDWLHVNNKIGYNNFDEIQIRNDFVKYICAYNQNEIFNQSTQSSNLQMHLKINTKNTKKITFDD